MKRRKISMCYNKSVVSDNLAYWNKLAGALLWICENFNPSIQVKENDGTVEYIFDIEYDCPTMVFYRMFNSLVGIPTFTYETIYAE